MSIKEYFSSGARLPQWRTAMPITCVAIRKVLGSFCVVLISALAACGDGDSNVAVGPPGIPSGSLPLRLQQIGTATSLNLNFPLYVTAPPGDNTRLFVVERGGAIKIVDLATQQVLPTPFLNLGGQVATDPNGEEGLLGLAFHPNFSFNGFFYVHLINLNGDTEIRRYTMFPLNPNQADASSQFLVMTVDQPDGLKNHKGGWLGFGQDGFLYVALGDGGGSGDPNQNAQNLNSLLGKILRINVNADDFPVDNTRNYAIPTGNPFAGALPGLDEIWSFGLRNPFRVSFDRLNGDFYIADVGQDRREEVNVATLAIGMGAGANFGWDTMEGTLCFEPATGCSTGGLVLPLVEYSHSNGACSGSITGGYVYRGSAIPSLQGTYFFADFCLGFVRSFRLVNGAATEQFDWPNLRPAGGSITSFGEDAAGELYITTQGGGLFRIVPN
jgi:glucose/arabinose dehydrogenase